MGRRTSGESRAASIKDISRTNPEGQRAHTLKDEEYTSIIKHFFMGSFLLIFCVGIGLILFFQQSYKKSTGDRQDHTIIIPKGASLDKISALLRDHKIIDNSFVFIWNARLRKVHASLKAGEYVFPKERTLESVLMLLASGKTVVRKFTAIEGRTVSEIIAALNQTAGLEGKIDSFPKEGELYPETYYFSYGEQRQAIIARMTKAHKRHLKELWQKRDPKVPLSSAQDALILAAIVEKETGIPEERPHIAGLFYNRLRLGMRLQSDPTVLYGLYRAQGLPLNRPLSRIELDRPTPFNTYLQSGLPPEPICNPGLSSLHAVLHPEKTDMLYFVADGTGGHIFSSTYEEHKRYHQALRVRRQQKTQKKL